MDEFAVIGIVGELLKELLRKNLKLSFPSEFPDNSEAVTLLSPPNLGASNRLSLFLYHILENGFMKNQPMEIINSSTLKYPPLTLDLYYLLTPNIKEKENPADIRGWDAHSILGRAMQILYDNSSLEGPKLLDCLKDIGSQDFAENIENVRIILNPISLDDLTKVWNSLDTPMRLSVSYLVRVIMIASEREEKVVRIETKKTGYSEMKGKKS